jgi:hypothetical protein
MVVMPVRGVRPLHFTIAAEGAAPGRGAGGVAILGHDG